MRKYYSFIYGDSLNMRKHKTIISGWLLGIIISVIFLSTVVYAKSSNVAMNIWGFDYDNARDQAARIASKIGGMKRKTSSRYDSAYYIGNKVTIGVSVNAEFGKKNDEYVRIINSGNKYFTIKGVKIGDSRTAVIKKMKSLNRIPKRMSPFQEYNNGTLFWSGNSICVRVYYNKSNKLEKWIYIIAPSG